MQHTYFVPRNRTKLTTRGGTSGVEMTLIRERKSTHRLGTRLVCELLHSSHLAPKVVFPYAMAVLLFFYSSDDYDVNWTTVQCVLMLKMVATAFDWSDGQKDESDMSAHHRRAAIYCSSIFAVGNAWILPLFWWTSRWSCLPV